jgi:hypothetical protein
MGSRCRQQLSTDDLHGTVVDVFDTTINIRTNKDELVVLSLGNIVSPVTINIAGLGSNKSLAHYIGPGDYLQANRQKDPNETTEVRVGNALILVRDPDYFENYTQRFNESSLRAFLPHVEGVFSVLAESASSRQGCLLNPDLTTRGILSEFLAIIYDDGAIDVASPEFETRLRNGLLGLCGRGPGFTPAGDDFISGFLAVINSIRSGLDMGSAIIPGSAFARFTTWTSFKLMQYSSLGLVDSQIQGLLNSASQGDVLSYIDEVSSLSMRGHTSGLDFSTGATFALYIGADSIVHSQDTDLRSLVSMALKDQMYQKI